MNAQLALLALTVVASMSHALRAQVTNGSLSGPIVNGNVPPGWTVLHETPDTIDGANNTGLIGNLQFVTSPPGPSPDGGTWVALGRYDDNFENFTEQFGQTITGLLIGQQYKVSWYAGNFGYSNGPSVLYASPNSIEALIDNVPIGTGATHPTSLDWFFESVTFTAAAASQNLSFELTTGAKSYMSIDGISISRVPEPAICSLGLTLLCAFAAARHRRI